MAKAPKWAEQFMESGDREIMEELAKSPAGGEPVISQKRSLKWLGHAGFIINSPAGKTILIDPWITNNPLCPVKLEDIKKADLVLVTHDHFDHAGNAVDISKQTGAKVIAQPETINRFKSELGLPANNIPDGIGMNTGGSLTIGNITVTMTQAFHSSATGSACGYIVKLEDGSILYHAGDTGIFDSMRLLAELYPMDIAMIPIGSRFTMDSRQAARALKLLNPRQAIPMHYQTLPMLEQSADNFVNMAKKEAGKVKVIVLKPGQEHYW